MARRLSDEPLTTRQLTKKPLKRCLIDSLSPEVGPSVQQEMPKKCDVDDRRLARQRLYQPDAFQSPVILQTTKTWKSILRKQRSSGKLDAPKQTSRVTFRGLVARLHSSKRKEKGKGKLCRLPSYPDISLLRLSGSRSGASGCHQEQDLDVDMDVDSDHQMGDGKEPVSESGNHNSKRNSVRRIEDIFLVEKQHSGMQLRSGSLIQKAKIPDEVSLNRKVSKSTSIEFAETYSQILDFLYLGSIECAYNEPLLCRLKIHMLVDLSNVHGSQVPPGKKSNCPCPCKQGTHFRSRLYVGVDDIEWENISQHFLDINSFIEGARKNNKNVLVCSYHGRSRAATAVIQYIMRYHHLSLDSAYNHVRSRRPQVNVNSGFWKALQRLELELAQASGLPFRSRDNDCRLELGPRRLRDAWAECGN